jgi:hypothetical protein
VVVGIEVFCLLQYAAGIGVERTSRHQGDRDTARSNSNRMQQIGARLRRSATTTNAFDDTVEGGVLLVKAIVRIHEIFLRGHLISPRLAVPDWRLRQ